MAQLSEKLARKASYSNPDIDILYGLDSKVLREFDINAAGLSMIRRFKMLGNKDIKRLEAMDKYTRNVVIGKIRGLNLEWSRELAQHIRDTMFEFMTENGASDEDIVSINNDAVTLIQPRTKVHKLRVNDIQFKISGVYSSLVVMNRVSFYRGTDGLMTVKGISDNGRELCQNYMIDKFNTWLGMLDNGYRPIDILRDIKNFKDLYCSKSLDINFYRNLRNGQFQMNEMGSKTAVVAFLNEFYDSDWMDKLDISPTLIEFIIPFTNIMINKYSSIAA